MPHVEGTWATPTICLEPVQVFILVAIFGWRRKSDGHRRFSSVYIEMARKGAKSTLTAVIALYCLTCEGEEGPQVIVGATTGEQAQKVFQPARRMAELTPDFREAFGVEVWARSITCRDNGGYVQTINAKASTQDGWNPHAGILDELHAHKTRALYDVIKSAFGSRQNPLLWVITTAGYDTTGVCYEQRKLVAKILDGVLVADHYFGIIFTLDEGDDPLDETKWIKANPMLGITPTLESMRSYAVEAAASPGVMGEFRTKRCNVWTTARGGWLNMERWKLCGGPVDLAELEAYPCYGGIDLASVSDMTAFVLVWDVDGHWYWAPRFYLPEETVRPRTQRGSVPYQTWADAGQLIVTPGDVTDYEFVEHDVSAALARFDVREIGYDRWNSTATMSRLLDAGAPLVEMAQGAKTFNAPMVALERAVRGRKLSHAGDPVLTWMASNVVARRDVNENMAPDKRNSMEKIDGIVAGLMAMGRALMHHEEPAAVGIDVW